MSACPESSPINNHLSDSFLGCLCTVPEQDCVHRFHKRHFRKAGVCIICISSGDGSTSADSVFPTLGAALLQLQTGLKKQSPSVSVLLCVLCGIPSEGRKANWSRGVIACKFFSRATSSLAVASTKVNFVNASNSFRSNTLIQLSH